MRSLTLHTFPFPEKATPSLFNDFAYWQLNEGIYTLSLDMPGMKKEEIQLSLDKEWIQIKAERVISSPHGTSKRTYSQSVTLPDAADSTSVSAKYENGVLTISASRAETPPKKVIEVK